MIKFTLVLWVCSFVGSPSSCLPPIEYPTQYNSWYQCSRGAHIESLLLISKMGYKYVNDNKIAMSYSCMDDSNLKSSKYNKKI